MLRLSHYLRAPALSWDVMFNMVKVEREIFSDAHIYLFFEKVWELEFLTFLRDTVKPTIRI